MVLLTVARSLFCLTNNVILGGGVESGRQITTESGSLDAFLDQKVEDFLKGPDHKCFRARL